MWWKTVIWKKKFCNFFLSQWTAHPLKRLEQSGWQDQLENHALFISMERWHACSSSLDFSPSRTVSEEQLFSCYPFSFHICATVHYSPRGIHYSPCKSQVILRPAASAPMEPKGDYRNLSPASYRWMRGRAAVRRRGWNPTKDLLPPFTSSGTTRPVLPWVIWSLATKSCRTPS